MNSLREVLADYLRMRRALGYKLEAPGRQLHQFVSYLERTDARTVTIENAVAWATQPASADPSYWGGRLSVVRQFARHLQTLDPACEVPASAVPPDARDSVPVHRAGDRHIDGSSGEAAVADDGGHLPDAAGAAGGQWPAPR